MLGKTGDHIGAQAQDLPLLLSYRTTRHVRPNMVPHYSMSEGVSMSDSKHHLLDPDHAITPSPEGFRRARAEGNQRLRTDAPLFGSFAALDDAAYEPRALPAATKELIGLVISVVKDCEECVYYHLERCDEEQIDRDQVMEALQIALVGAGSVTVPLLRRAVTFMSKLPHLGDLNHERQE
ncbi:carboxymuconolactone decarboxylase family protein [Streptomyces sp. NPDC008343]|uniref:carboxymuconolactone decarboxylase family protein n=1 Tax=Streptomyces sp. NPDC008343 TaxID=3364828 RepID=UPI0036E52B5A